MSKLKVGDAVWHGEPPISYIVISIDEAAQSASIKSTPTPRVAITHHNVRLAELTRLDDEQNTRRKAREAAEES